MAQSIRFKFAFKSDLSNCIVISTKLTKYKEARLKSVNAVIKRAVDEYYEQHDDQFLTPEDSISDLRRIDLSQNSIKQKQSDSSSIQLYSTFTDLELSLMCEYLNKTMKYFEQFLLNKEIEAVFDECSSIHRPIVESMRRAKKNLKTDFIGQLLDKIKSHESEKCKSATVLSIMENEKVFKPLLAEKKSSRVIDQVQNSNKPSPPVHRMMPAILTTTSAISLCRKRNMLIAELKDELKKRNQRLGLLEA